MARTALSALDELERLGIDSFLFIADEADPRAEKGGANAAEMVTANAAADAAPGLSEAAGGLETASVAPDGPDLGFGFGAAPEFQLSLGPAAAQGAPALAGGTGNSGGITLIDPPLFSAKGGIPGPPSGGGGGDDGGDGGGGDGVLTNYYSGADDGNPDPNDPGYDIWIEFKGSYWTVELQGAFIQAADYLTTVITDDIGGGGRYRGKIIDDLYVSAELMEIDGSGGVLGRAGPQAVWTATGLTAAGVMEFDIADADTFLGYGLWDDIVMHELMHVLGFGTLWEYGSRDLVNGYEYVGQWGLDAYRDFKDDDTLQFIPVEDGGGSGTAGGHWDEAKLDNELMTGYIDGDTDPATTNDNFLSAFSVMSLQDLGYAVDYQDYPYDGTSQPYEEPQTLA